MKRKKISILLLFSLFIVSAGLSQEIENHNAEYINVSESVVLAKHAYGANITCIATNDGLIFIDCGMKTELAKQFRLDMEKKFNSKTFGLFVTHAHIDHFLGMGAFSDVKVFAAESSKKLWEKQLAIEFNEKAIQGYTNIFPKFRESVTTAKPFIPNEWFKEEKVLGSGEDELILTNTGGHTIGSSSLYFAKESVIVTGDLVQVDQYPYFGDPTTDMDKWLATFRKWESLPIKKVCAGHGRIVGKEYITTMKNYFESLIASLKELKKKNLDVREVVRHEDLPKGYWGKDKERPRWFDYCIASLYQKITV